jgi:aspartate/tyrosine/aromatic aminotransferase
MSSKAQNRLARITQSFLPESLARDISRNDCAASFLDAVTLAPTDSIFLTKQQFAQCKDPTKMNLGVGAYRTNEGKPWVLPTVTKAEGLILADAKNNKEYLPITGYEPFLNAGIDMVFGKDFAHKDRIATCQSLSGTGGLRLIAEFVKRFMPGKTVYLSNPTWGNHKGVCNHAGVRWAQYSYFDAKTRGLDIVNMLLDLQAAPMGSIVMLHSCAHNPTGVDPTPAQWAQIYDVVRSRGLFPWFDTAYQGFASGDLVKDAYGIQYFANQGYELVVSQSFAKNMGLYNERVGGVYLLTQSAKKAKAAKSQFAAIVRPMYSNPPVHGARIVHKILTTPALYSEWIQEIKTMSGRILEMRELLKSKLLALGTPGTWNHITDQIGMFSYTGLTPAQCEVMKSKHSIFLLTSGRISMAGINSNNVDKLARAIDDCVRNH